MRYTWLIVVSLLTMPAAAQDVQPGFDCTKARSPAEKLICSDASLSRLDSALSRAYKEALQEGKIEKESQRDWIKNRDVECASSNAKECLRASIKRRTAQLRQPVIGYSVSDQWPTGVHASTFGMLPQQGPICRALADAANQSTLPKPLTPYHEPPLEGEGIVEASWQPVTDADPIEIIEELYRASEAQWSRELRLEPGWHEEWEKKLAAGKARLEWTTLVGFRDDAPATRVVRLMDDPAGARRATDLKSTMMATVDGDFAGLHFIRGPDPFDSAFTFQGRSYLFGISQRDWDNSFTIKFSEPQQEIRIDKSYEGPGAGGPAVVVAICRLLYHKSEAKSP
jgi:uncharacterized protein YecT (DUF1311 family)